MRQTFLIILLFFAFRVSAQTDSKLPKFILKTNLTSPLDIFTFPTIDLSIEKPISNKFSITGSFGIEFYDYTIADTSVISLNGYKTSIETRYYPKGINNGFYIGAQLFLRHDQYTSYISYMKTPGDSLNIYADYSDKIGVIRKCVGINSVIGFQSKLSKSFCLDCFAGLGIMYRGIKNTNRDYTKDKLIYYFHGDWPYNGSARSMSESSEISANLTFGVRLGWICK